MDAPVRGTFGEVIRLDVGSSILGDPRILPGSPSAAEWPPPVRRPRQDSQQLIPTIVIGANPRSRLRRLHLPQPIRLRAEAVANLLQEGPEPPSDRAHEAAHHPGVDEGPDGDG